MDRSSYSLITLLLALSVSANKSVPSSTCSLSVLNLFKLASFSLIVSPFSSSSLRGLVFFSVVSILPDSFVFRYKLGELFYSLVITVGILHSILSGESDGVI